MRVSIVLVLAAAVIANTAANGTTTDGHVDAVPTPPKLTGMTSAIDYPTLALLEHRQGTVRYRLAVNATGRATSCQIVASSGSEDLDHATCDAMKKGGRFSPGRGSNGRAIDSVYVGSFRWTTPNP